MNAPNGNGNGAGRGMPDDDEYPKAIFAAVHRDPDAFLSLIDALDRVLRSGGEQPFSPCSDPCPICQPALWLADSY